MIVGVLVLVGDFVCVLVGVLDGVLLSVLDDMLDKAAIRVYYYRILIQSVLDINLNMYEMRYDIHPLTTMTFIPQLIMV